MGEYCSRVGDYSSYLATIRVDMDGNITIHLLMLLGNLFFFLVVIMLRNDWRGDREIARNERWEMQQNLIRVIKILETINGAELTKHDE